MNTSLVSLSEEKKEKLFRRLYHYWKLIEYDPLGKLSLANGGTTDAYINLREARNYYDALNYLAAVYKSSLSYINKNLISGPIERLVEVPDSVSCLAPLIATRLRVPYTTIRKEAKDGRLHSKVIGQPKKKGERVIILDDVITDGGSKIGPYRQCLALGMDIVGILVLIDRDEGWRDTFAQEEIHVPVYCSMTLDDVRRFIHTPDMMEVRGFT